AVAFCAPVGIVKLAGTVSTAGLLLVRATTAPVPCAPDVSVTVMAKEFPPTTWADDTAATVGKGGGGGGVPFTASFVTKASWPPLSTWSKAFAVVGKWADLVSPVTYTLPAESSATSRS